MNYANIFRKSIGVSIVLLVWGSTYLIYNYYSLNNVHVFLEEVFTVNRLHARHDHSMLLPNKIDQVNSNRNHSCCTSWDVLESIIFATGSFIISKCIKVLHSYLMRCCVKRYFFLLITLLNKMCSNAFYSSDVRMCVFSFQGICIKK